MSFWVLRNLDRFAISGFDRFLSLGSELGWQVFQLVNYWMNRCYRLERYKLLAAVTDDIKMRVVLERWHAEVPVMSDMPALVSSSSESAVELPTGSTDSSDSDSNREPLLLIGMVLVFRRRRRPRH